MRKPKNNRNKPLQIEIKNGVFTISIGVNSLAWAFEHSEYAQGVCESSGKFIQLFRVTDPDGFAEDVKDSFNNEEEDGSTELTKLFDKECLCALEGGSEYIEDVNNENADERPFEARIKEWGSTKP